MTFPDYTNLFVTAYTEQNNSNNAIHISLSLLLNWAWICSKEAGRELRYIQPLAILHRYHFFTFPMSVTPEYTASTCIISRVKFQYVVSPFSKDKIPPVYL